MPFLHAGGDRLEYRWAAEGASLHDAPALVLLHEGLGSAAMWKDFPDLLAEATGCRTLVYSRLGYGQSDVLRHAHRPDYMHREALEVLPQVLEQLDIDSPILIGHSDGASIALIHAGAGHRVRALALMAPHVFVEDLTVDNIVQAKTAFETTDMAVKLARYHADAFAVFRAWNDIWLHPEFRGWNIESYLSGVVCPVLAIQGADDEYGTLAQLDAIERGVRGRFERLILPECRHSPHRDQKERTLEAIAGFVERIRAPAS